MSQERQPNGRSSTVLTILVAIAILAIYLLNTRGVAVLAPTLPTPEPAATLTSAAQLVETATAAAVEEPVQPAAAAQPAVDTPEPEATVAEPTATMAEPTATMAAPTATAEPPTATPKPARPTATATPRAVATIPAAINGVPTIRYDALPREAKTTIGLIDQGGPFPYSRDGVIFQNREGLLPRKARGYYHEYTVITPGESDRGARRIITGEQDELYYTDDHYDSFKRVVR